MGTTMTLVQLNPDGVADFAHVGDSRAYLLRDDELDLITTDHTLVNELIELGRITPEEAEHHPHRHLITRVLGLGPVGVDTFSITLTDGDRLLLCSDGLNTMVSDVTIKNLLAAGVDRIDEIIAFLDSIKNGTPVIVSGDDGRRALDAAIQISALLKD